MGQNIVPAEGNGVITGPGHPSSDIPSPPWARLPTLKFYLSGNCDADYNSSDHVYVTNWRTALIRPNFAAEGVL